MYHDNHNNNNNHDDQHHNELDEEFYSLNKIQQNSGKENVTKTKPN